MVTAWRPIAGGIVRREVLAGAASRSSRVPSTLDFPHLRSVSPSSGSAQHYANHRRLNPMVHFFLTPVSVAVLIAAIMRAAHVGWRDGWVGVAIGATLVVQNLAARSQALTVQNRVIQLEMRLRLAEVLPHELALRARTLPRSQIIALRFASDAELPSLVERALAGELSSGDAVKRAVRDWQPDTLRA
jgi:hypothetical protein